MQGLYALLRTLMQSTIVIVLGWFSYFLQLAWTKNKAFLINCQKSPDSFVGRKGVVNKTVMVPVVS